MLFIALVSFLIIHYILVRFCLSQDSPDAVRVIVIAVSIFGPRKIIQQLMGIGLGADLFFKSFNEIIIPWSLKKFSPSTAARLDLLLALLDDECFSEQWDAVIKYLVNQEKVGLDPGSIDKNYLPVLAILMEKVRERTKKSVPQPDMFEDKWHHELLDLVATYVMRAFPPSGHSDVRFLWYVD